MSTFEDLRLKEITDTLKQGCVTVLAGREAVREDLLALNLILHSGSCEAKRVAVISDKTEENILLQMILCIYGGVNIGSALSGKTSPQDGENIATASKAVLESNIVLKYLNDVKGHTLTAGIEEIIKQSTPDLILVDLKMFSGFENGEERKQFAKNLLSIRELAKMYKTHFIICPHFATPFTGWRGTHMLVTNNVQLIQLFEERGNVGLNFFGGEHDGKLCALTYNDDTRRFKVED